MLDVVEPCGVKWPSPRGDAGIGVRFLADGVRAFSHPGVGRYAVRSDDGDDGMASLK